MNPISQIVREIYETISNKNLKTLTLTGVNLVKISSIPIRKFYSNLNDLKLELTFFPEYYVTIQGIIKNGKIDLEEELNLMECSYSQLRLLLNQVSKSVIEITI